ncbi:hypothetical protein WJX73_004473 [Symbiochloris irregularis]|uniref:Uncharacterized protein n=1 Tax=Symbiochloris irregularis TaxID=706552 RepID=A0AAW1PQH4_9CHLO
MSESDSDFKRNSIMGSVSQDTPGYEFIRRAWRAKWRKEHPSTPLIDALNAHRAREARRTTMRIGMRHTVQRSQTDQQYSRATRVPVEPEAGNAPTRQVAEPPGPSTAAEEREDATRRLDPSQPTVIVTSPAGLDNPRTESSPGAGEGSSLAELFDIFAADIEIEEGCDNDLELENDFFSSLEPDLRDGYRLTL